MPLTWIYQKFSLEKQVAANLYFIFFYFYFTIFFNTLQPSILLHLQVSIAKLITTWTPNTNAPSVGFVYEWCDFNYNWFLNWACLIIIEAMTRILFVCLIDFSLCEEIGFLKNFLVIYGGDNKFSGQLSRVLLILVGEEPLSLIVMIYQMSYQVRFIF